MTYFSPSSSHVSPSLCSPSFVLSVLYLSVCLARCLSLVLCVELIAKFVSVFIYWPLPSCQSIFSDYGGITVIYTGTFSTPNNTLEPSRGFFCCLSASSPITLPRCFQGALEMKIRTYCHCLLQPTYCSPLSRVRHFFLFAFSFPIPLWSNHECFPLWFSRELELCSMLSLFNTPWHQRDCYRSFGVELFHFKYSCDHASCSDPLCSQLSLLALSHSCECRVKGSFTSLKYCGFNT